MAVYSTYSGNLNGYTSLFVFDSNSGETANFIGTIPSTGSTTDYVFAGGFTMSSQQLLNQFLGNISYLKHQRTATKTVSAVIGGNTPTLTTADSSIGITTTTFNYIPDPRITNIICVSGTLGSFTGELMDELSVYDNSGVEQKGYLGRIMSSEDINSSPGGVSGELLVEVVGYGKTGSDQSAKSNMFLMTPGNTIENIRTGATAQVSQSVVFPVINVNTYKQDIINQVGMSFAGADVAGYTGPLFDFRGITSATFGDNPQHVYFNLNNPNLLNFVTSMLPAFDKGLTGNTPNKQNSIFTILAGTTIDPQFWGVTFNAASGGTLQYNSEFEEFAHYVIHSKAKKENEKSSLIYTINQKSNIRDIDKISF